MMTSMVSFRIGLRRHSGRRCWLSSFICSSCGCFTTLSSSSCSLLQQRHSNKSNNNNNRGRFRYFHRSSSCTNPTTTTNNNNNLLVVDDDDRKNENKGNDTPSTTLLQVVDLRSDTVTAPSRPMLEAALTAPTGDDVFGEDPTVHQLEDYTANLLGKECGLFVPTGTMSNLLAIMAHCSIGGGSRSAEIIVGKQSHICLWEGGNVANLGGISSRQIPEQYNATFDLDDIRECYRIDPHKDVHLPTTTLLCLENTHNMMGGIALTPQYMMEMGQLVHDELNIALHVDGARIFNAALSKRNNNDNNNIPIHQQVSTVLQQLCQPADSISVCLSKGLGAPMGSVLVGSHELIHLARRARKRCGGGMRQAGVMAAMGLYALQHNVSRLVEDHRRAQTLASALHSHGFPLLQHHHHNNDDDADNKHVLVDTNIVYFALPHHSRVTSKDELCAKLYSDYAIKLGGGYGRGGKWFRAVTHMDVNDEGIDRAIDALVTLCLLGTK